MYGLLRCVYGGDITRFVTCCHGYYEQLTGVLRAFYGLYACNQKTNSETICGRSVVCYQVYGGDQGGDMNRMSASRCAELMVIATANRLYEVWIAYHPVLFLTYCMQFLPWLSFR